MTTCSLHPLLRALPLLFLAAVAALAPNRAHAQSTPPDVIELNDGSFMRGTIVERIQGQYVVFQLVTGETRRFEMSAVRYAGPADQSPSAESPSRPPPPPTPSYEGYATTPAAPAGALVHVTTSHQGARLTLHRLTGTATAAVWTGRGGVAAVQVDSFASLCTAPCDIELPLGSYYFGVSHNSGNAARAGGGPYDVRGPMQIDVDYDDRTGLRVAGWTTFIVGALAATAMSVLPLLLGDRDWLGPLIGGGVTLVIAMAVGYPLAFLNDSPSVRVRGMSD